MSFACSDSCENGITEENLLAKRSGKSPFSGFQSNGLEFSKCQILGLSCAKLWWKKKRGVEKQNSKKGFEKNEHACIVLGVFVVSDLSARQYLKVPGLSRKIQSTSKLRQVRK